MKMPQEQLALFIQIIGQREGFMPAFWQSFGLEWEKYENTQATFNPLACTDSSLPSTPLPGNPDGVKQFGTFEDGIEATIRTLDPASHYTSFTDYYPTIRLANKIASIERAGRAKIVNELQTWGTTNFAVLISSGWNPPIIETPAPSNPALTVDELNSALQDRMALVRLANAADHLRVRQAVSVLHSAGFQF